MLTKEACKSLNPVDASNFCLNERMINGSSSLSNHSSHVVEVPVLAWRRVRGAQLLAAGAYRNLQGHLSDDTQVHEPEVDSGKYE
jgi:hypothetical protein